VKGRVEWEYVALRDIHRDLQEQIVPEPKTKKRSKK
jgi:hypothetical protein